MYKRGDIAVCGRNMYIVANPDTSEKYSIPNNRVEMSGLTGEIATFTKYTGPIYEKGGQRFVPSGEPCRLPKKGDWYFGEETTKEPVECMDNHQGRERDIHRGIRRILLPISELPEEEPEFKVGDWITNHMGDVAKITGFITPTFGGEPYGAEWDDGSKKGNSYFRKITKLTEDDDGICPLCKGEIL